MVLVSADHLLSQLARLLWHVGRLARATQQLEGGQVAAARQCYIDVLWGHAALHDARRRAWQGAPWCVLEARQVDEVDVGQVGPREADLDVVRE